MPIHIRKLGVFLIFLYFGLLINLVYCENELIKVQTSHIVEQCVQKCPDQNRTNPELIDVGCGSDCYINQCTLGCKLWEQALDSSCQIVCNKTDEEIFEPNEFYCVIGCNDALNRYFKWLKAEIGTPPAPALVADSLTATSLSLEWEIPTKLSLLTRDKLYSPKSYLVQWRYEELAGDWKFCRNQSMGENSTVRVDNLQPYTKYRFRVALLLSSKVLEEVLVSDQSVIIMTLASGVPLSEPAIVRAVAVDHTRISVSWEPGPFPNGPVLSYVLQIKELSPNGYYALKDIPASENEHFYMLEKLTPSSNYSVSVTMRNAEGEGPAAMTIVSTPTKPEVKDDEPQPRLILGAEFSVLSQGSDLLAEPPKGFYTSDHRIMGVTIHIAKKWVFVSDEAGYIYRAPLEVAGPKTAILSPQLGLNFMPLLLSVDWLNDHLYILGEVAHPHSQRVWQISRCGLDGHGLTIAIAGLNRKPGHIEVDPYNGYLFWLIPGSTSNSGLFRLDLGDISNGVKHEVKPLQMVQGGNLGAFAIDHTRFRILVPSQNENTMISVSLDGKDRENIRNNTQSPKFSIVKSLAMANGLFYWTNGEEVLKEEYHSLQDSYYHNAYPDLSNRTFVSVCVNLPSAQPIPVPVNPPSNVQALLSAKKAKVSWRIPHLLGNQGKGAWQEWFYELEIIDDKNKKIPYKNIEGTTFTVDNLLPNTNYTFRAAAYTSVGRGPWSTEFRIKTLKSFHDRYLIWSSNDGLLQSDVIGEHIHTLIPKSELDGYHVSDITWFEDILYFVSNSTLKYYNRTSGAFGQISDIDSIESIAIDWIGRRLYWSNPTQQLIIRSHLNGEQQEPLFVLAVIRELKVDSLHGYIYFSTGHSVEACRLNGKNRKIYYSVDMYSRRQVMGLTLNMDKEKIYWIVRSYKGSSLFSAPMAGLWISNVTLEETVLEEKTLNGPLTHFSDRLLWLQDNHTVIIGDMTGRNLAHIKNSKLIGLKAVSVIDPTHHIYPNSTKNINVIPEHVSRQSIKINGNWRSFIISWDAVKSVTYGDVFYEIRIHCNGVKNVTKEINSPQYQHSSPLYPPYTALDVTVRAFTFWGSSSIVRVQLSTPAAEPSVPMNTRIFITYFQDPLRDTLNIRATFRWNHPKDPNGPILGYRVFCWFDEESVQNRVCDNIDVSGEEFIIENLVQNVSYYFQVQAYTSVGVGNLTTPLMIETSKEKPVPKVLVTIAEQIVEVDLDLMAKTNIVNTGNPIAHLVHIAREHRIFWINENNELMSYNKTSKVKLTTISATTLSMTVDWVERVLYWSQIEGNSSVIYSFNLNKFEGEKSPPSQIIQRKGFVHSLIITPLERSLYWIETKKINSTYGEIRQFHLDNMIEDKLSLEKCFDRASVRVHKNLILETSSPNDRVLIGSDESTKFFSINTLTNECTTMANFSYNEAMTSLVKDSGRLYWITDENIRARNDYNELYYSMNVTGATRLLAYYHQNYPLRKCLLPIQRRDYKSTLLQNTEHSLILRLPVPEMHQNCSTSAIGIKYTILYKAYHYQNNSKCTPTTCTSIFTYDNVKEIVGLKSFTRYKVQVGINNYYGEKLQVRTIFGPPVIFATAAGAPSVPTNVSAEALTPTKAIVEWLPPIEVNGASIWYEVHWQTENAINGVKNKQQLLVPDQNHYSQENLISVNLTKLLPSQSYSIWVRAYSSNKTFSESAVVVIETFPEPENIFAHNITAYSMRIHWRPQANIEKYNLQYTIAGTNLPISLYNTDNKFPNVELIRNSISVDDNIVENIYVVNNLQPKTQYKFSIVLHYPKRDYSFLWPPDSRFVFETLGDSPSAPGKPILKHVRGDVYQVSWDASKDNGATIVEYSLEALETPAKISNRIVRSTIDSEIALHRNLPPLSNFTAPLNELQSIEEPELFEENWIVHYNGTDTYWIIKDLHPIHLFAFRVRARNSYGWGPYSSTSDPVSEPYVLPDRREFLILAISIPALAVVLIVSVCLGMTLYRKALDKKKMFHDNVIRRIPDVELANLRELPRTGNFIHSNNILYTIGPLTDSEVALLPHIRRDQITMTEFLGSGAFGEVYEGLVKEDNGNGETRVAIKTLRKGATEQEKSEFLQEAKLMSNFKHEHILRLIGVCFDHDSLYIIMELMQGGDLLSFLRQSRPSVGTPSSLTLLDLISMCVDVASGCRYLEEMHFVHRDLACRNCLVSSADPASRVVKIGDFGLARDIYKNDYYRKEGEGLLPVRWMSPESLVDGVFTSQSDIWAFGVLCWEIMTLGQQPYPARNNVEVLHYVRDGGRLGRPADCPDELYQLMLKCWSYSPEDRPTFRYCLDVLKTLKEATSDSVQITVQCSNRVPNGGVFNRSYLLADENHNTGTLKFVSNELQFVNSLDMPVVVTPSSSNSTTSTIPKYLELLPGENDESMPTSLVSDGYEIPRPDILCSNDANYPNNNNNRTELIQNCQTNTKLTVALPPNGKDECSSMEALLPQYLQLNKQNRYSKNNNNNKIDNTKEGITMM